MLLPVGSLDPHLPHALRSVLSQTGVELSVLLLLDGISPQGLPLEVADPRVTVLSSKRRLGVAGTLNRGLASAESELIARMDADDVCLHGRLAIQANYLMTRPHVAMVGSSAEVINGAGIAIGLRRVETAHGRISRGLIFRNQFIHPSVMFRRSTANSLGGYNSNFLVFEDWELWLRIATIADVANVSMPLLQYRVHNNQSSRTARPWSRESRRLLASKRECGRSLGLPDLYVRLVHAVWMFVSSIRRALRRLRNAARESVPLSPRKVDDIYDG